MSCPPLEELLQWLRAALDPASKTAVEAHLSTGCASCETNRQWLKGILDETAKDDSFEFSEETIQWSVAQFKAMSGMLTARRSLLATLIFDTLRPAPAMDVRAAAPPVSGRQMLFKAEAYEVDLRIEPEDESATLLVIGQVVDARQPAIEMAGLSVRLTGQHGDKTTQTNARGIFRFRGIAAGDYDLVINLVEGDLSIHGVTCRSE